jgi:hypothetical protein
LASSWINCNQWFYWLTSDHTWYQC